MPAVLVLLALIVAAAALAVPFSGVLHGLAGLPFGPRLLGLDAAEAARTADAGSLIWLPLVFAIFAAVQAVGSWRSHRRVLWPAVATRAGMWVAVLTVGAVLATRLTGSLDGGALLGAGVPLLLGLFGRFLRRRGHRGPGGVPQPGTIWWAEIPFEESRESKDRPCLVLSASGRHATVLMLTSQDKTGRREYVQVPTAGWDRTGKPSWLKTDRLITVPLRDFRRPAGPVDAQTWDYVSRIHPRAVAATA